MYTAQWALRVLLLSNKFFKLKIVIHIYLVSTNIPAAPSLQHLKFSEEQVFVFFGQGNADRWYGSETFRRPIILKLKIWKLCTKKANRISFIREKNPTRNLEQRINRNSEFRVPTRNSEFRPGTRNYSEIGKFPGFSALFSRVGTGTRNSSGNAALQATDFISKQYIHPCKILRKLSVKHYNICTTISFFLRSSYIANF